MRNLLKACLVDGYGSVAVSSLTRSGSVVTVTTSAPHGFSMLGSTSGGASVGPVAQISGANEADYNGRWRVTGVISTTVFTFNIGAATPASPATGSITARRAAAGWTEEFTNTNRSVFRTPFGTNRFYLRVDDNTPSGGDARNTAMRGYETMIDVDNGSGLFPKAVQEATGLAIPKSETANATVRSWTILADEGAVYILVNGDGDANGSHAVAYFGDLARPEKPGDAYHTGIVGGTVNNLVWGNGTTPASSNFAELPSNPLASASLRNYLARSFSQLGSALGFSKVAVTGQAFMGGATGMAFPSPANNGFYAWPVLVTQSYPRGYMPGLYSPWHSVPFVDGDTVTEVVGLSGRVLLAKRIRNANNPIYQACWDITGPWR